MDKTEKLHIVEVDIASLKPAEYNPRQASEKEYNDLKNSLQSFGFTVPIVVNSAPNRENTVIGGHFRLRVAADLGYTKVPVVYVSIPDIEKEKELNLRLNKNLGNWDFDLLANIDEELLKIVGFDSFELDGIFGLGGGDGKADEIPALRDTNIERGDIFTLGKHRLMCGDSRGPDSIQKLMNWSTARLCFTSPPYNMAGEMYANYKDDMKSEEFIRMQMDVIMNIKKYLRGFIFWNVSYNRNARWEFIEILYRIIKEQGLKFLELVVWDKGHALPITSKEGLTRKYEDILVMADDETVSQDLDLYCLASTGKRAHFNKKTQKGLTNYWRIGTNKSQHEHLKACFPVELPEKAINLMTQREENVLEPFAGSGSTLIACERTNRKCFAMEIDPQYCQVIIDRWEKYTNLKAVKVNN